MDLQFSTFSEPHDVAADLYPTNFSHAIKEVSESAFVTKKARICEENRKVEEPRMDSHSAGWNSSFRQVWTLFAMLCDYPLVVIVGGGRLARGQA